MNEQGPSVTPAPTGFAGKHAGGRPRRGSSPARVVPARMNAEELERKRELAGVSRSELMRLMIAY